MSPVTIARSARRALLRGLTLVEIIVVIGIAAIVTAVAIGGTMQLPSSRLRRSATMITSAIKVAYTRATATSRDIRLVIDLDRSKIWLEESEGNMLVQSKDRAPAGGADPVTDAERAAVEEGDRLLKGPPIPKPRFQPIDVYGFGDVEGSKGGKSLQSGIVFRTVQTAHDDAPRKAGRAYLYFWPGGLTERASIQLSIGATQDDNRTLTLAVSPLTGKVAIKAGAVDLQTPTDDEHLSDRPDNGF